MKFKKACKKLSEGQRLFCKDWPVSTEYIYLSGTDIVCQKGRPASSMFWGYKNYEWEEYKGNIEPIRSSVIERDAFVCSIFWSIMTGLLVVVVSIIVGSSINKSNDSKVLHIGKDGITIKSAEEK